MIRELVLQLKLGRVRPAYFAEKYGVDILRRFEEPLTSLTDGGFLAEANNEIVALTRAGLLRIDSLLPRFFQAKHAGLRYT
jgi:oxygen-independent coproporphyrinogen-3 oxidase